MIVAEITTEEVVVIVIVFFVANIIGSNVLFISQKTYLFLRKGFRLHFIQTNSVLLEKNNE